MDYQEASTYSFDPVKIGYLIKNVLNFTPQKREPLYALRITRLIAQC